MRAAYFENEIGDRCFAVPKYLFIVAQIFNLPYRRFVIGRTLLAAGRWQVKNLRYSSARQSRNQKILGNSDASDASHSSGTPR